LRIGHDAVWVDDRHRDLQQVQVVRLDDVEATSKSAAAMGSQSAS
jgi:hypothetical protein